MMLYYICFILFHFIELYDTILFYILSYFPEWYYILFYFILLNSAILC